MALKKRYYSMNGRLIAERDKTGQTGRIDYMTDALGSVTATVDQSAQVVNTYRYKPYGGLLAKTGSGSDPKFRWVGSWGYRETSKTFSDVYVRARHYSTRIGSWSTADPLRGAHPGKHSYAMGSPVQIIDATGMAPCPPGDCCTAERLAAYKERIAAHCGGKPQWWSYCDVGDWKQKCLGWIGSSSKDVACREGARLIESALEQCARFGGGGQYGSDEQWGGTVFCCWNADGYAQFCGALCCSENLKGKSPCAVFCLIRHEQYHGLECRNAPRRNPNYPPRDGEGVDWREECAYYCQANCLWHLFKDKCGWKDRHKEFSGWSKCESFARGCHQCPGA